MTLILKESAKISHHPSLSRDSFFQGRTGRMWELLAEVRTWSLDCLWLGFGFNLRFNTNILFGLTPPRCYTWGKHSRTGSQMHLSCWIDVIHYADKE